MIISLLGKGGSGKSSVATQLVLWLHKQKRHVLAIDADHNMDLVFNLVKNTKPEMSYLGSALSEIEHFIGVPEGKDYKQAFLDDTTVRFSFSDSSRDPFTEKYSKVIVPHLRIMAAGPQTKQVLYGKKCGHVLATPLKAYLPLLELSSDEDVVLDEKAGADGVTTGIVTGVDVGIIVCEPSLHSIKTARQIADLLTFYGTPYLFVGNKIINTEDEEFIRKELGVAPVAFISESAGVKRLPGEAEIGWHRTLAHIEQVARRLNKNDRLSRTIRKFQRSVEK